MTIDNIDALFENLFAGDYPGEEGPEPLNKRFNWLDPKTKKRPPQIPPEAMPGPEDMFDEPTGATPPAATPVPIKHLAPSDREGRYSLADLIPPDELATIDQLLDLKLRAQNAKRGAGKTALNKEFNAHRSEFESIMKKIVDVILEDNFER